MMGATSAVRATRTVDPASGLRERKPRRNDRAFLVVDESATIRLTIAGMLGKLGYAEHAVNETSLAEESIDLFGEIEPDVVFIELDAERGDGLPVALEMLERNPFVKLVVLTSRGRDCERVQRAVRAGAFAVIEKPLRYEKIRTVLQEIQMEEGGIERMK